MQHKIIYDMTGIGHTSLVYYQVQVFFLVTYCYYYNNVVSIIMYKRVDSNVYYFQLYTCSTSWYVSNNSLEEHTHKDDYFGAKPTICFLIPLPLVLGGIIIYNNILTVSINTNQYKIIYSLYLP